MDTTSYQLYTAVHSIYMQLPPYLDAIITYLKNVMLIDYKYASTFPRRDEESNVY